MTEHSDLLGKSEPEPKPTPKPRGRPRKITPAASAPAAAPATPSNAAPAATDASAGAVSAAPVDLTPVLDGTDAKVAEALASMAPPVPPEPDDNTAAVLAQFDAETANRKALEALFGDAPLPVAPVSTEFAAAQAQRITIIGQGKREYAYQRLMRAGKRL